MTSKVDERNHIIHYMAQTDWSLLEQQNSYIRTAKCNFWQKVTKNKKADSLLTCATTNKLQEQRVRIKVLPSHPPQRSSQYQLLYVTRNEESNSLNIMP